MSKHVEMSRSWSSAHDWKSCKGQKLFESSNLSLHLRQTKPRPVGRGFLFGGNGRVRALAARSAVRDGCPQAGVSKANRRRRLLGRRRENLSISAKNKSHPIRVVFCFYMVEGEIRIMSEHAGGMFIGQFKNWPILLSDFSVPRKEKPVGGKRGGKK